MLPKLGGVGRQLSHVTKPMVGAQKMHAERPFAFLERSLLFGLGYCIYIFFKHSSAHNHQICSTRTVPFLRLPYDNQ